MQLSSLFKRRGVRVAGQAVVITALVGGTAAYAAADTTVDLRVDGETREVRSFGNTVEDVLEAADVEVGERDVVAPGLDERVDDGSEVVVNHARELRMTVDGEERTVWTTARTVNAALDDAGVRDEALISASRSQRLGRSGLDLDVSTPKDVTVRVDGKSHDVVTPAPTVAGAIEAAGVEVSERDRLSVPASAPVVDGLVVAITRMSSDKPTKTTEVGFDTVQQKSGQMYVGEREVKRAGRAGERTVTYLDVMADGERVHREVVSDEVTQQPRDEVVLVGVKERPKPKPAPSPEPSRSSSDSSSSGSSSSSSSSGGSSSGGSSSGGSSSGGSSSGSSSSGSSAPAVSNGSTWDRLAQCESGGNWSINTGNGYYGGLQFSAQSWQAVGGSGLPHQASRAEQIAMGEKLRAVQGWGAWPACSAKLGLR